MEDGRETDECIVLGFFFFSYLTTMDLLCEKLPEYKRSVSLSYYHDYCYYYTVDLFVNNS